MTDTTITTIISNEAAKLTSPPSDKFLIAQQYMEITETIKALNAYREKLQDTADKLFTPDETIGPYIWKHKPGTSKSYKNVLDSLHDNLPDDLQVLATELIASNTKPTLAKFFERLSQ